MKITADHDINAVLAIDEERMTNTLTWLAPELVRLQSPTPRRGMVGSITVAQAAKIARIPLAEFLYALNLAAGEPADQIDRELNDHNEPSENSGE